MRLEVIPLAPLDPAQLAACLGVRKHIRELGRSTAAAEAYAVCCIRLRFDHGAHRWGWRKGAIWVRGRQLDYKVEGLGWVSRTTILASGDAGTTRLRMVMLDEQGQPAEGAV